MTWNLERTNKLKKMWKRGDGIGFIARALVISKDAAYGKVKRLDLEGRRSQKKRNSGCFESVQAENSAIEVRI